MPLRPSARSQRRNHRSPARVALLVAEVFGQLGPQAALEYRLDHLREPGQHRALQRGDVPGVAGGERGIQAVGEPRNGSLVVAGSAVLEAGVVVQPDVVGRFRLDLVEDRMCLGGAPCSEQNLCQTTPGIRCAGVPGVDRSLHRRECVVGAVEALVGFGKLAAHGENRC